MFAQISLFVVFACIVGGVIGMLLGHRHGRKRYSFQAAKTIYDSAGLVVDKAREEMVRAVTAAAEINDELTKENKAAIDLAKHLEKYLKAVPEQAYQVSPDASPDDVKHVQMLNDLRFKMNDFKFDKRAQTEL